MCSIASGARMHDSNTLVTRARMGASEHDGTGKSLRPAQNVVESIMIY